ncbi:hypothetical protein CANCADRAFT_75175 [Tortispora caseinolytica NRRL Y-17796]|uniref:Chromatin modification-related protein n=1 Tax=Tortispora caseinolytica NRRL Y-17796 TaxID=767744 RepID=A0A1E4TJ02_9ASCO|nr:hypothetical protein CANCADRAFT_75175 [Tortispora caseinolytica NRRL Y-17796]
MDAAYVLETFVTETAANLPAEIAHIMEELASKDVAQFTAYKRAEQRDAQIHKFIRTHGSLADNPKEASSYPKIEADLKAAIEMQDSKIELAQKAKVLISKHVKRIDDEIRKLQNDGVLSGEPISFATPDELLSELDMDDSPTPASRRLVSPAVSETPKPTKKLGPRTKRTTDIDKVPGMIERRTPYGASSTTAGGDTSRVKAGDDEDEEKDAQVYCVCQQVSYGDMIACDNPDCYFEWFHYGCVGLKAPPQGIWYCPSCSATQSQARRRK